MALRHAAGRTMELRIAGLVPGLILGLALAACASPPDLEEIEEGFAAEAEARAARVDGAVARTDFGGRVAAAVQSSPRLSAASARILAASAEEDGESGAFMPQVSLGAQAETSVTGGGGATATPLLRVSQLVYDGGSSASRRTAARARVFQSRGARIEEAAAIALQAVEIYHDLRAARERRALAQRNQQLHAEFLAQTEDRAAAGASARSEVLTARSRLADATSRAVESQSRLDRAEAAFREVFGAPPPGNLPPPPAAPALPDGPEERMIMNSPRLRSMAASIKAAEADLAAAQAARYPSLSVSATGSRPRGGSTDVGLGLSLDYDLGLQGRQQAAIKAAQARLQTLEAERAGLVREIRRALEDVRSDRRAGAARLAAAREAVSANEAAAAAAREQFSIGRQSLAGLLDAQRDLFQAGEARIAAEREQALTGYAALSLTGDILDVFAITLPPVDEDT